MKIISFETELTYDDTYSQLPPIIVTIIRESRIQADKQYLRGRTEIKIHTFDNFNEEDCILDANFVNTKGRFFGGKVSIIGKAVSFNR